MNYMYLRLFVLGMGDYIPELAIYRLLSDQMKLCGIACQCIGVLMEVNGAKVGGLLPTVLCDGCIFQ